MSGDSAYRFADCLTVQFVDDPTITDITDTDGDGDVPNDDVRDVFNVRDDTAGGRRTWILQPLNDRVQLKSPMVPMCRVVTALPRRRNPLQHSPVHCWRSRRVGSAIYE